MLFPIRCLPLAALTLLAAASVAPAQSAGPASPSPAESERDWDFEVRYGEVYATRDSGPLKADVYLPKGEGPFPGVLVVHGGAWYMGIRHQMAGFAREFAKHGLTAVSITYRLAPQHKFPAQIEDCKEAVRWMRRSAEELKVDPERIGAFGYSAGGQLVALLGATDPEDGLEGKTDGEDPPSTRVQAVAAGGAPCEFRYMPADVSGLSFWLGGSRGEVPDAYRLASPTSFATPDDPPMFFYHGEDDQTVPIDSARAMVEALSAVGVPARLYAVQGKGHIQARSDPEAVRACTEFLVKHLARDGGHD